MAIASTLVTAPSGKATESYKVSVPNTVNANSTIVNDKSNQLKQIF